MTLLPQLRILCNGCKRCGSRYPPRVKEGSAIPVTILGTWPGGENEMTPIYTTPFSSNPTSILTDITGDKLENVRLTDRCSGAVSITPDGHDVSALHPASCSIGAEHRELSGAGEPDYHCCRWIVTASVENEVSGLWERFPRALLLVLI